MSSDLLLLYDGTTSSTDKGLWYPLVLRNAGPGHFWDVDLRSLHDGEEVDRRTVRKVGPHSESEQVSVLVPVSYCAPGEPGAGLKPLGHATAEALVDGTIVASVELQPGDSPRVERVPRTPEEVAILLKGRQDGWEYLLFAAILLRRFNLLEPKYRDHELGYSAPQAGTPITMANTEALAAAFSDVQAHLANFERVFDRAAQERAFGASGEPGDPERIEHLALRMIDVYEGLMDWAARIRATPADDDLRPVVAVLGRFVDRPLEQFRAFIRDVVAQIDRLPALFAAPAGEEPIRITLQLTLETDPELERSFQDHLAVLQRRYGG